MAQRLTSRNAYDSEGTACAREVSLAALPGADGRYPVTETFSDGLGRATNSLRAVWFNGARDAAYTPLATLTAYPYGTDHLSVMTDPLGVETVTRAWRADGADVTETVTPGVTNRTVRHAGGATVGERFWDGKWTRETRSDTYGPDGCRVETVVTESSDYPAVTNSVTAYDFLGRVVSAVTPLGVTSNFYDGASSRILRVSRTGSPDTLYAYDALGNLTQTALDADGDGRISHAGPDRITATHETCGQDASAIWWRVTSQAVWAETDSAACVTSAVVRVRLTGLGTPAPAALELSGGAILTAQSESVDWLGNVTRTSTYTDAANASVWTVTETPGSAQPAIQKTAAGRTVSTVSSTAVTNACTFDGFGRQVSATDGRGNTTLTAYDDLGQVAHTEDAASNRTSYAYDGFGRQIAVTDPLTNTTHTAYDHAGNVTAQWGATYPVAYEYDTAGRRIAMATTRDDTFDFASVTNSSILNPNSSLDVTQWRYDAATGLLTNKVYADGSRIRYTYTEGGRLATRVWARGVTTAYSYNTLGQLISVNYSDATPGIVLGYDRMGNTASAADASGTRVFTHDPDGQMLSDTLSALGQTFALLESYDTFGRNTGYALSNTVGGVSSLIAETEQGYDAFGRISEVSVSGIPAPFHYDWLPGSELQQSLVMPNGVTRETAYEPNRDLPVSVTHTNSSGAVLTRRTFTRDAVGHLTGRTRYRLGDATNRLDVFSQNTRGELVCAALGTNSYAYAFDNIGNRLTTEEPGLSAVYFANGLNQYTRISNSVPSCEFISAFDADGNQTLIRTATGIWNVTYNAENRPVCFSNDTAVIEMAYDYMGRRFEYKETASGAVARHECYLYRGYLQVAALDLLDGTNALHAIAWDPTEPVATRPLALQTKSGWFAYGFDQVKNVTELFDSVGDIVAAYDYAPFGAVTTSSGSAVAVNPITFSSEIDDATLGLIHYTFRPLNTLEGRWFGPDPIGDLSFRKKYSQRTQVQNEHHLYLFCANSALETIDPDGAMAQPLIDRRHPPKGKRLIVVPQNTILIVYGHHFQNPKHSRHGKGLENIWNIVASTDNDKGCAYAAVVTCMAGAVPNEIPLPGYSPIASNIELPINDFSADTDMGRELGKVKKAADKEAKEMCKRCCVKKIHVEVDSYGLKLSEYLRYPTLKSWDVPCK